MKINQLIDYCTENYACDPGIEFLKKHKTVYNAWRSCTDSSYMFWLLQELEIDLTELKEAMDYDDCCDCSECMGLMITAKQVRKHIKWSTVRAALDDTQ